MIFFVVEPLLYLRRLFNVVIDLKCQLFRNCVLICQLFKNLKFFAAVHVLLADVRDDRPHSVYIVGHYNATECFDEDYADGLLVVDSHDVPETDR